MNTLHPPKSLRPMPSGSSAISSRPIGMASRYTFSPLLKKSVNRATKRWPLALTLNQRNNGSRTDREDEQHQQIPQVQAHPREVAAKAIETLKVVGNEVEERAGETVLRHVFDVDLQHDVSEDAHDQRHEQAQDFILDEHTGALVGSEVDANAGHDEDDGHQPEHHELRPDVHALRCDGVLDMPAACIVGTARVENEYGQNSEDA